MGGMCIIFILTLSILLKVGVSKKRKRLMKRMNLGLGSITSRTVGWDTKREAEWRAIFSLCTFQHHLLPPSARARVSAFTENFPLATKRRKTFSLYTFSWDTNLSVKRGANPTWAIKYLSVTYKDT